MDALLFVTTYLKDSAMHFWFSGLAGLLVFSLIATILFAVYRLLRGSAPSRPVINIFILLLALSVALFVAWYAHVSLDAFTDWYTTPLNAPLIIIR